jgi:hypothetical protein
MLYALMFLLTLGATLQVTTNSHASEIIDDRPLTPAEVYAEVPLIGYRVLSSNVLFNHNDKWVLSGQAIAEAASKDPTILQMNGNSAEYIKQLPLQQIAKLYKRTNPKADACTQSILTYSDYDKLNCRPKVGNLIAVASNEISSSELVDREFVRRTVADWSDGLVVEAGPDQIQGLQINSDFASFTKHQYSLMGALPSTTDKDPVTAFRYGSVIKVAGQYASYSAATTAPFTKVGIGTPLIMTASEKRLEVEPSISHNRNIYWVQLAINPAEDLRRSVTSLSFFVSLKTKGAVVLELAPLRFGNEQDVKVASGTPEVKIETPRGAINLGKIFNQEISYKVMKPTIIGTGLQASEFGWALSDDAIDMSAKRFVAVIGVPKKSKTLDFEMVVNAKVKEYFQVSTVSSQPIALSSPLPSGRSR